MKVKKVITAPWFIALVIIVVIVLLYFLYSKLESDTNAALTVINNPGKVQALQEVTIPVYYNS